MQVWIYSEYMKYHYVPISYFSRYLAAEDCWASGKTSRWCDLGSAMLPVHFCHTWILVKYSVTLMLFMVNGSSGATGYQGKTTSPILDHGTKEKNASFTAKVSYNAKQPENLQDKNWLPRGLHKNLGAVTIRAVVGLLTRTGALMSATEMR